MCTCSSVTPGESCRYRRAIGAREGRINSMISLRNI
jgi:hypothetical protein